MDPFVKYSIPDSDPVNASAYVSGLPTHYSAICTSSVLTRDQFCHLSEELQYHLARIERTLGFKENWDHQGGLPPERRVVVLAKKYVKEFGCRGFTPNHVAAGPNGEIYVEYRGADAKEAQLQFVSNGKHELLLVEGDEYPYEGPLLPSELMKHFHG